MGAWFLGLLPKFAADWLARVFKDWRRDQALKDAARKERDLEVQKETVEVLARNAEGVNEADDMTEEERRRRLTDGS